MWGSWWTHNETEWPTGNNYATYAYSSADTGAWNSLLNSSQYGSGYFVSCLSHTGGSYNYSYLLSYGAFDMPNYTCQGSCPGTRMHGGQCKPFMNLIAYRSGIYQGTSFAWKSFPSDTAISNWSQASNQMPVATFANIVEGDFLRMPNGHAVTIVRKISSSRVVVLDSNWLGGGDGDEVVRSHELGFTGAGGTHDLGSYRVLKCVYTGGC